MLKLWIGRVQPHSIPFVYLRVRFFHAYFMVFIFFSIRLDELAHSRDSFMLVSTIRILLLLLFFASCFLLLALSLSNCNHAKFSCTIQFWSIKPIEIWLNRFFILYTLHIVVEALCKCKSLSNPALSGFVDYEQQMSVFSKKSICTLQSVFIFRYNG